MRPRRLATALAVTAIAVGLCSCGSADGGGAESPVAARVDRVVDGDTILARVDGRSEYVRYIGIDTPESVKPGSPVECFGTQASEMNRRLIGGRAVRLEFGPELRDRYGRILAYVSSAGRLVNAELVRRGFATAMTIPPDVALAGRFERLERQARAAGRGLWSACR